MGKPLVVCELGLNHQGSIEIVKAMIAMAADFGADFVKFQKRCDLDAIYTQEYLDKPVTDERLLKWGKTIREQREFLEFGKDEYDEIDKTCKFLDIGWFASVWDVKAVEFMEQYQPQFIKIPSLGITNIALIGEAAYTGIPVVLSTGGATLEQVVAAIGEVWCPTWAGMVGHILHCTAEYPCDNASLNMERITTLRQFLPPVGFSNHCPDIIHIIQAAVMGASMVEFHITLDRNMDGPDHRASIGPMGFKRIMDHLDNIEKSWGDGKPEPSEKELAKGRHYLWRQQEG